MKINNQLLQNTEYQICYQEKIKTLLGNTWVTDEAHCLSDARDKLQFNREKNPQVDWFIIEKKVTYTKLV